MSNVCICGLPDFIPHQLLCLLQLTRFSVRFTHFWSFKMIKNNKDDYLLLFHSIRPSEQSINDGWLNCHTLLGKPKQAIENYDQLLEQKLDLNMTRMRARLYIQYAEALFVAKDMSCCFYAIEGLKLVRAVGSRRLFQRTGDLASKLVALAPYDERVKELLRALQD
jgi:hypothetical protein